MQIQALCDAKATERVMACRLQLLSAQLVRHCVLIVGVLPES